MGDADGRGGGGASSASGSSLPRDAEQQQDERGDDSKQDGEADAHGGTPNDARRTLVVGLVVGLIAAPSGAAVRVRFDRA